MHTSPSGSDFHTARHLASVHAPCRRPLRQSVRNGHRASNYRTHRLMVFNGDVVADDKMDSAEKTAAASSRGFAGVPQKPEDMNQTTPAASKFMQVPYCKSLAWL